MNQQQIEIQRQVAETIISTIDSLVQSLNQNERIIEESKISERATSKLSRDFIEILRRLQIETTSTTASDPAAQLAKMSEIISSVVSSIESSIKSSGDEVIRLEATQAGMQRALASVRATGENMLLSIAKIEQLADEPPSSEPRKTGERPEGISNRRNAAALRKSRESNDT